MNQPHKHKDVIIAWANGEEIEFRDPEFSTQWNPIKVPTWLPDIEYRVKPKPVKNTITFRVGVAAFDDGSVYTFTVNTLEDEQARQVEHNFIGWISDWKALLRIKAEE